MSKFLHAVSTGSYDSYRIAAVYLSRKEAKDAVDVLGSGYYVESIPLRTGLPHKIKIFRREARWWDVAQAPEEVETHHYEQWDVDPLHPEDLVPSRARWMRDIYDPKVRAHVGGTLQVSGTVEKVVESTFASALEQLTADRSLRLRRSWKP